MTEELRQLVFAYKDCFGTESGKKVIADLKRVFNFELSIIPKDNNGMTDIYEVLRNEGKRSVILHILKVLNKDLDEKEKVTETEQQFI